MGVVTIYQSMWGASDFSGLSGRKALDCWLIDYSGQLAHIGVTEEHELRTTRRGNPAPLIDIVRRLKMTNSTDAKLAWSALDLEALPKAYQDKFNAAAAAITKGRDLQKEASEFYVKGLGDQIPAGEEMRLSYRFARWNWALAPKTEATARKVKVKALVPGK